MPHLTTTQLTTLKQELNTDPTARGYAPLLSAVNYQAVADKVNQRILAAGTVAREPMETADLIESIDSGNFNQLTTANATKLGILLSTATVRIASTQVQGLFSALFGAGSVTMTNFAALKTRPASRTEVLFGVGEYADAGDIELTRTI